LIPTIRAGRLVHAFPWSEQHGAEPSNRIGRGGFDYHGRACLRSETWGVLARALAPNLQALRIS